VHIWQDNERFTAYTAVILQEKAWKDELCRRGVKRIEEIARQQQLNPRTPPPPLPDVCATTSSNSPRHPPQTFNNKSPKERGFPNEQHV
jgi:hypothetical protein